MTDSIPKEVLLEWLNDPITKKVMDVLRKVRKDHQEVVLDGQTLRMNSTEETAMQTTFVLGKIAGLNLLLEMKVEDEDATN